MSFMLKEIHEQPEAIARFLDREAGSIARLATACQERAVSLWYIAARGTSDHAAVYAKYLAETTASVPVALAAASVFTLYGCAPRLDDALVLGISQSGAAADSSEILEVSRRRGWLTACITNHADSPMAQQAEHVLLCGAGEERSLPATKTYSTSLAAVAALVSQVAADAGLAAELRRVPDWLEEALQLEDEIARRVTRYRYMEECVVLARGYNQCTALETALKLTETSYVRAQSFSAADFLHGPIAAVEEGTPCLVYSPGGMSADAMRHLVEELRSRRAELLVISDQEDLLAAAQTPLPMPSVPEPLSPLVAIVVGQLFAHHLAVLKGRDPDQPRGLKKVTVTH